MSKFSPFEILLRLLEKNDFERKHTFIDVVSALCYDGNEIWINVFVQNGSIVEYATLWVNVLVSIFWRNFNDLLWVV